SLLIPCLYTSILPIAAGRCGRLRTTRNSSRDRPRPSCPSPRTARGPVTPKSWCSILQRGDCRHFEIARGPLGVAAAENRLTGDQDARAGFDDARHGAHVDAAVDFDDSAVAGLLEECAHVGHFRLAPRNEGLTAEAGVDRHDEHEVDVGRDLAD